MLGLVVAFVGQGQRPDTCSNAPLNQVRADLVTAGTHQVQHRIAAPRARSDQAAFYGASDGKGGQELTEITGEGVHGKVPSGVDGTIVPLGVMVTVGDGDVGVGLGDGDGVVKVGDGDGEDGTGVAGTAVGLAGAVPGTTTR